MAHASGAALGWLTGKAVAATRPGRWLAAAAATFVVLVGCDFYMPWDGYYAWHRGYRAYQHSDYPAALYWYSKAEKSLPGEKHLHEMAAWLEQDGERTRILRQGKEAIEKARQFIEETDD